MTRLCFVFVVSLLGGCALFFGSGDHCAGYRRECNACAKASDELNPGSPSVSCDSCKNLAICEAGNQSDCAQKKTACDEAQKALENSGFPEKTSSACTDYYKACGIK